MNDDARMLTGDGASANASPPIGVIDLIVLTTAMAIAFSLQERLASVGWSMPTKLLWFQVVQRVLFALVIGIPVAAIHRLLLQKRSTGKFLNHPGHWVLFAFIILNVGAVIHLVAIDYFFEALADFGDNNRTLMYLFVNCVLTLASGAVFLFGSFASARPWKHVLVALMCSHVVQAIQSVVTMALISFTGNRGFSIFGWITLIGWVEFLLNSTIILLLIFAVVGDIKSGRRRDLLHWGGVFVLVIAEIVSPVFFLIYSYFLFDPSDFN